MTLLLVLLLLAMLPDRTVTESNCMNMAICRTTHSPDTIAASWGDLIRTVPTSIPGLPSPCWHDLMGVPHCLPAFFLAGVAKCGTTDMFLRLQTHPQLVPSRKKEPHWITRAGCY